jgi:UDP-2,4-diacetamido-2,4,6-trideoxy-beta-L-altropyranose hydrolase
VKVVFRVDASSAMGGGHLVRCHTLAKVLRTRGVKVSFICRIHNGNLIDNLTKDSFPVTVLPAPAFEAKTDDEYADWLGVTQANDADETCIALNNEKPDWLIVDHYALDEEWERKMRPFVKKIMVIDDLANRIHDCEILLDQNFSVKSSERYHDLVKDNCFSLLGPRYALLHEDYNTYRKTQKKYIGEVKSILIYLGGVDPDNITCKALQALSAPTLSHLHVNVVVGNNSSSNWDEVNNLVTQRPLTELYKPRHGLVDLIAQSDLALGAGGATTWERLCLGLPTLLVSVAKNQIQTCESLAKAGLVNYAGDSSSLTKNELQEWFEKLINQPVKLSEQSNLGQLLVDGQGIWRVTEILSSIKSDESVTLRPAEPSGFLNCHGWEIKDDSFLHDSESMGLKWNQRHKEYLETFKYPTIRLYVAEVGKLIVGRILFEKKDNIILINSSVDSVFLSDKDESNIICIGMDLMNSGVTKKVLPNKTVLAPRVEYVSLINSFDKPGADKNLFSISILSDQTSWINKYIHELIYGWLANGHSVSWVYEAEKLGSGDFCFYLSCSKIIPKKILSNFKNNLVVHESELPQGKGWSPLSWQILDNKNKIPVTLFEADEKVDSGVIYDQEWINLNGNELINDLRNLQAQATLKLCKNFIYSYPKNIATSRSQKGKESFYTKRTPKDSEINPEKNISEQFNLLRIVDNEKYPAFFKLGDDTFQLQVSRYGHEEKKHS